MTNNPLTLPVYDSFETALNDCRNKGYEYQNLVDVVVKKNKIWHDATQIVPELDLSAIRTLMAIGLALKNNNSEKLTVLDFGGGGGYHFWIAKSAFGRDAIFDWRVVETPLMAKEASKLIKSDGLSFSPSIDSALKNEEKIDLVFTSSALQYCQDPLRVLNELVDIRARYLCITRTPFSMAPDTIITKQRSMLSENGPGALPGEFTDEAIEYPISFVPRIKIQELIQNKYTIRFSVSEEAETLFLGNAPVNKYYGFFCEIKPS